MSRKKPCPVHITDEMYDEIHAMYRQYRKTRQVGFFKLESIFELHRLINHKFNMHKSERTLRRIYRNEFPREHFTEAA